MVKKRILSIILCICLSVALSVSVCAEEGFTLTEKQEEAYSTLGALGFLDSYYDIDTIAEQDYVSRAVFAEFIYGIYNSGGIRSENLYFHDVPKSHYARVPISSLVEQGVISVSDTSLFYPENYIKPVEAAKMIIYSLGYEDLCAQLGGYPAGVEKLAHRLKLYDGIELGDKVSFCDMLVMTYNSISVELFEVNTIRDDGSLEYAENGETYLSKYHDIYVGEGVLKGYNGISVFGESVDKGCALIDDTYFNNCSADVYDSLGKDVKYYYHSKDGKSTLLCVVASGRSDELVLECIKDGVIFDKTNFAYKYYDGKGKQHKAKLSKNVSVVYNGAYLSDGVMQILEKETDSIRLVATNGGSEYNAVIIEDYESYIFEAADFTEYIIYLTTCAAPKSGEQIKLKDYEVCDIILANGTKGELEDIPAASVLSVERSQDNSRVKIVVCDKFVKGIVAEISNDGEYRVITIGDAEYTVHKNISMSIGVGDEATLKLDTYGYVVSADVSNTEIKFGYLLKSSMGEGLDKTLRFKIYANSGEMIYVSAQDKVRIDGKAISGSEAIYEELGKNLMPSQLIAFSLNSEGEIKMIDRAEDYKEGMALSSENMLVRRAPFGTSSFIGYNQNTLGPKIRLGNSTLCMSIPNDVNNSDEEMLFNIGKLTSFSSDTTYNAEAYQYGLEPGEFSDIVIVKGKSLGSEYFLSTRVLITDVRQMLDKDGEIVYKLSGYHGNTFKELMCTAQLSKNMPKVQVGDAISVADFPNNIVNEFTVTYGPSATEKPIDKTYRPNGARITMVYVHDVIGSSVFCGFESGETWDEIMTPGRSEVFIYDSEEGKVTKGSTLDLVSYKNAGDDCSEVFVYTVNGEVRNFIIYR